MNVFGDPDTTEEYGTAHPDATDVEGVVIVGYDPAIDRWLALEWSQQHTIWLAGGGREGDEPYSTTAIRELEEETGYTTYTDIIQLGGPIVSHYFNDKKNVHRQSYAFAYLFILDSTTSGDQHLEEHEDFQPTWLEYGPLRQALKDTGGGVEHWLAVLTRAHTYVTTKL